MTLVTTFITIWAIGAAVAIPFLYFSGKKALSIFPTIKSVEVRYRFRFASGYSVQAGKAKLLKGKNAIDIVVTDKELWLKSMLLFAFTCKQADLLHKVPLGNISKVKAEGKAIVIDFKAADGNNKQVMLYTKRPDALVQAMERFKSTSQPA